MIGFVQLLPVQRMVYIIIAIVVYILWECVLWQLQTLR